MTTKPIHLETVLSEQRAWASEDSLAFFEGNRSDESSLYPSERAFLPAALSQSESVLDIGCACGGFADIMRHFNDRIVYTGIDIVPEMIDKAREKHPTDTFLVSAGHELPFSGRSFDLVHCSGVVHLNSYYQEMIAEMWRVTEKSLLFDMRLTDKESFSGSFNVSFDGGNGGVLPYHVVNIEKVRSVIDGLNDAPIKVTVAGYPAPASPQAFLPEGANPIMAFLLLEREAEPVGWHMNIR